MQLKDCRRTSFANYNVRQINLAVHVSVAKTIGELKRLNAVFSKLLSWTRKLICETAEIMDLLSNYFSLTAFWELNVGSDLYHWQIKTFGVFMLLKLFYLIPLWRFYVMSVLYVHTLHLKYSHLWIIRSKPYLFCFNCCCSVKARRFVGSFKNKKHHEHQKKHSRKVRDEVRQNFKAGLGYKTTSQALNISRMSVQSQNVATTRFECLSKLTSWARRTLFRETAVPGNSGRLQRFTAQVG